MPLKIYLRGGIWHYRGTVAKRRLRGSTGVSKEHKGIAARAVAEIETNQWKCNFDGPTAVLTFAQAALMYRAAGKSTRFLDKVEDHFKDTLVKDIKPGTIRQMALDVYPGCSGAGMNRMGIVPARAVINHAAEFELCPRIRVKRFGEETKEKTPMTLAWARAFQASATPHLGAMVLFTFLTGARPSEALGLQWEDVNLEERTALIRESKIGKERRPHLPDILIVAMANIPRVKDRGVFIYQHLTDLTKAWNTAVKDAKIERLTPHCGRHGFITHLLRSGIDVKTVSWLGDITPETLLRTYAHALKDRKLTDILAGTPETQSAIENERNPMKTGTT
jgi:integrase